MKSFLNTIILEFQSGFCSARSTIDMIFTIRQLQEGTIEQNIPIYILLIDNAFNTVNRHSLWLLLQKYGCPPEATSLIEKFHIGMIVQIVSSLEFSDKFTVNQGVKQGCVFVPLLFFLYLSTVLEMLQLRDGIYCTSKLNLMATFSSSDIWMFILKKRPSAPQRFCILTIQLWYHTPKQNSSAFSAHSTL